jgi:5-methylcytosine-specific restriction endonuclease McrA
MKQCPKCGEIKPLTAFSINRVRKDGFCFQCKECSNIAKKAWYETNGERCRKYAKLYVMGHREQRRDYDRVNAKRVSETAKAWRLANAERQRKNVQNWNIAHPERRATNGETWRKNNPDRARLIVENRRARRDANGGMINVSEWQALLESHGKHCLCCGETKGLTLDHVIPLSRGGVHSISNAQPLCSRCNSTKGVKIGFDYRPYAFLWELSPNFIIKMPKQEVLVL